MRVKFGSVEIECEGEETFVKSQILFMVEKFSKMDIPETATSIDSVKKIGGSSVSVATIAQKLNETDGSGILFASCIYLTNSGKTSFSRDEIINSAKTATTFYKNSIFKNMSAYLKTLCKAGKLNDVGSGNYSLGDKGVAALKTLK